MTVGFTFEPPNSRPDASPEKLWELQLKLDLCAQRFFGDRNPQKKLYQPKFVEDGPYVRNTFSLDGGFAELSLNAAGYWPTTIYELAHETVHLLDPRLAPPHGKGANWLEEGIAVNFSLLVARTLGNSGIKANIKKYQIANQLYSRLGGNLTFKAKQIRERCGHFSDATVEDLLNIAPNCPRNIAEKLVASFS